MKAFKVGVVITSSDEFSEDRVENIVLSGVMRELTMLRDGHIEELIVEEMPEYEEEQLEFPIR